MLCVDLKADVIAFCEGVARDAGFLFTEESGGMIFRAQDIRRLPRDRRPDLVVSLHACDVATDVTLDAAADLGAKVILSTPCCHRYLDRKIVAPELAFVTRHPKLRSKLAEALTDSLRCLRLEATTRRRTPFCARSGVPIPLKCAMRRTPTRRRNAFCSGTAQTTIYPICKGGNHDGISVLVAL